MFESEGELATNWPKLIIEVSEDRTDRRQEVVGKERISTVFGWRNGRDRRSLVATQLFL